MLHNFTHTCVTSPRTSLIMKHNVLILKICIYEPK
jgi:hypothetical protein